MPFKPGQSGNPGGRPKAVKAVEDAARAHTEAAIQTLADIALGSKHPAAARVTAAVALLDRGWGKPKQMSELSGPDGQALPVSIPIAFVKPDAPE